MGQLPPPVGMVPLTPPPVGEADGLLTPRLGQLHLLLSWTQLPTQRDPGAASQEGWAVPVPIPTPTGVCDVPRGCTFHLLQPQHGSGVLPAPSIPRDIDGDGMWQGNTQGGVGSAEHSPGAPQRGDPHLPTGPNVPPTALGPARQDPSVPRYFFTLIREW